MATFGSGLKIVASENISLNSASYTVPAGQYLLFNATVIAVSAGSANITVGGQVLIAVSGPGIYVSQGGCVAGPGTLIACNANSQGYISGVLFSN